MTLVNVLGALLLFSILDRYQAFRLTNHSIRVDNVHIPKLMIYPDPPCPSEIYCHGRLLHTIQMAHIYNDSKTFVDMKLKDNPENTLVKFDNFLAHNGHSPTKEELKTWVEENFESVGSEFEPWTPDDWIENPRFLDGIEDKALRQWASDLNHIWFQLGRKMKEDVAINNHLYSIIHVDNPVIVPGGRFSEFYYWDSYWIIRGLLLSEMYTTAKGMLRNFISISKRYGFIPNGGRNYFTMRSQPPVLAAMIKSYVDATMDIEFAVETVATLESEFQFWMINHTVLVNDHLLARYGDRSNGPRPESYREDVLTAEIFETEEEKEQLYSELKAGAESGMDYSSRWFIKDGTNAGNLTDIKVRSIVPVELNAFLFWNAKIIAEFYLIAGNFDKHSEFTLKAYEIHEAIEAVLWDDNVGAWLDYDLINKKRRNIFSPTNLAPLWMGCYNQANAARLTEKVLKYIETSGVDDYPGGVPNTLNPTGEQWDYPNVWPPMQYMLVWGLDHLNDKRTRQMAFNWAQKWVTSNYLAYNASHAMFEKYNAEEVGGFGHGGEYETVLGFGWTNGVIMDFLNKYGKELKVSGSGRTLTNTIFVGFSILLTLVIK